MTAEQMAGKIEKNRIGYVRDWGEMSSILDSSINPDNKKYLRVYFRTQVFIAEGRQNKARKLFGLLTKFTGFDEFESAPSNQEALSIIDIAVRGETRR